MAPRLRTSNPSHPGFTRRRRGAGWSFVDADGARVVDEHVERIRQLAIPPAWQDVWICPTANGHLQAIGTDDAGRRQYIYHEQWTAHQSRVKFERMEQFAAALPDVRSRVSELLDTEDEPAPTREQVLALAVRLLDHGCFRIGSSQYVAQHGTYGLVTLRREHVRLEPPLGALFDFPAKHGIRMQRRIEDVASFRLLTSLYRRRSGPDELFAAKDGRAWSPISAAEVNAFLRETAGIDCSAKDFRTWHGTVACAIALASTETDLRLRGREPRASEAALKREIATAVRATAEHLGNTPAVARSSYVDPRVIDRYRDGRTVQPAIDRVLRLTDIEDLDLRAVMEAATLRLLHNRTEQTIARAAQAVIDEALAGAATAPS